MKDYLLQVWRSHVQPFLSKASGMLPLIRERVAQSGLRERIFAAFKMIMNHKAIILSAIFTALLMAVMYPEKIRERADAFSTHLLFRSDDAGPILVDTPQIFTRGRLVNDRTRESDWLQDQLKRTDELMKDGQFGVPELRHDSEKQFSWSGSSETTPDPLGEFVAKPRDVRDRTTHASPQAQFEAAFAYREKIREQLMATDLDDRHDIDGNSVYRLNFNITTLPPRGSNKIAVALAELAEFDPSDKEERLRNTDNSYTEMLFDWKNHIQELADKLTSDWSILMGSRDMPSEINQSFQSWLSREMVGELKKLYKGASLEPDAALLQAVYVKKANELSGQSSRRNIDLQITDALVKLGTLEPKPPKPVSNAGGTAGKTAGGAADNFEEDYKYYQVSKKFLLAEMKDMEAKEPGTLTSNFQRACLTILSRNLPIDAALSRNYEPGPVNSATAIQLQCPNAISPLQIQLSLFQSVQDLARAQYQTPKPPFFKKSVPKIDELANCLADTQYGEEPIESVQKKLNRRKSNKCQAYVDDSLTGRLLEYREPSSVVANFVAYYLGLQPSQFAMPPEPKRWWQEFVCPPILFFHNGVEFCKTKKPPAAKTLGDFFDFEPAEYSGNCHYGKCTVSINWKVEDSVSAPAKSEEKTKPATKKGQPPKKLIDELVAMVESNSHAHAYSVSSSEARLPAESAWRNGMALKVPSSKIGTMAAASSDERTRLDFFPKVLGFRDWGKSSVRSKKSARFGWAMLPLGHGSDGYFPQHSPEKYAVNAHLSLPGWWKTAHLTVRTCWIDLNALKADTLGDICSAVKLTPPQTFSFKLPGTAEDLMQRLRFFVEKQPALDRQDGNNVMVEIGKKASIVVRGTRLWRSPVVMLSGQRANLVEVMPDMKGIIAHFDCIDRPADFHAAPPQGQSNVSAGAPLLLQVTTSEGQTQFLRVQPFIPPATQEAKQELTCHEQKQRDDNLRYEIRRLKAQLPSLPTPPPGGTTSSPSNDGKPASLPKPVVMGSAPTGELNAAQNNTAASNFSPGTSLPPKPQK